MGWLRSQCYQGFEIAMPAEHHAAFRAEVEARLDELARPDGTFDQTFVRLDALAHPPGQWRGSAPMNSPRLKRPIMA